jgi:hypothetical protein
MAQSKRWNVNSWKYYRLTIDWWVWSCLTSSLIAPHSLPTRYLVFTLEYKPAIHDYVHLDMQHLDKQSAGQNAPSWWQRHRLMVQRTLGIVLTAAVLLFFTRVVTPSACWVVFILVSLISFPIWQYRTEYLLFRRRSVLSGVARPESRIRIFLWKGGVTKVTQVAVAMALAWTLLVLVSQLSEKHWYVLALDGIFLSLIVGPATRILKGDIKERHLGVITRRWPLFLINGIVLTGAIMMLDFFSVGADDTRRMAWNQVAEQAFTEINGASGCVLWGMSAGAVAAVEALSWHLSELVIPNLPDLSAKVIAWLVFLLRAATVAWLYTALLLGINALLNKREGRREAHAAGNIFSRSFFLTIIILALPFFYAAIKLSSVDPAVIEEGVSRMADSVNPCKPDEASRARLVMRLDKAVAIERRDLIVDVDSSIDQGLDGIFADVEANVDDYLDWYFTVIGEYQRLGAVFTSDVAAAMSERLEEYLFVHSDFEIRLEMLDSQIDHLTTEQFANTVPYLNAELDNAPCDIGRIDLTPLIQLDSDKLRASAAATSGVGAGIVASKALAKKTAAVIVGKVAAKKSIQSGAALATKTLAKKGASVALSAGAGATLCSPAGPMAILCGVTAGVVTWFSVDKALIEIDEALNREEMRTDILKVLEEQRVELGSQLKQKHYLRIDSLAVLLNDRIQRTFTPYKDGMGP